jgi:two-component system invasion response regulator UvrY
LRADLQHEDAIFGWRALQAGSFGYVTKASAPVELVDPIHTAAAGRKYLSPEMAQTLALQSVNSDPGDSLSSREFEVLRMLAQGHSIEEIAGSMGLSTKTVANHQSAIKQKRGAGTGIELSRRANQLGLESQT